MNLKHRNIQTKRMYTNEYPFLTNLIFIVKYKIARFHTPHRRPGGGHTILNCFSSHMFTMCVFVCNPDNILMTFLCLLLYAIISNNRNEHN